MDERRIGYLLKVITDRIKVKADTELKSHNLTLTQSRVLAYLNRRSGQATQKEIEDYLEVSHPTVVGVVYRMEQNGFLHSWFDLQDKRNKMVELTDMALKICREMDRMISAQEEKMLRSLSKEQTAELEKTLMVIYKNLD